MNTVRLITRMGLVDYIFRGFSSKSYHSHISHIALVAVTLILQICKRWFLEVCFSVMISLHLLSTRRVTTTSLTCSTVALVGGWTRVLVIAATVLQTTRLVTNRIRYKIWDILLFFSWPTSIVLYVNKCLLQGFILLVKQIYFYFKRLLRICDNHKIILSNIIFVIHSLFQIDAGIYISLKQICYSNKRFIKNIWIYYRTITHFTGLPICFSLLKAKY